MFRAQPNQRNACDECVDVVDFSYAFNFLLIF